MAIRVRGSRRYRGQVLNAIRQLCPCFIYTLTRNGTVQLQSPTDRGTFCRCYCDHRAGCNLISDLVNDANTVTIRSGARNSYNTNSRTLRWNPTRQPRVRTVNGRVATPPAITLGHELIHANHQNQGRLAQGTTNGIRNEEINTVRGENQLRAELTPPQPQRTHYGRRRVPNPGAADLDTTDRFECNCDKYERAPDGDSYAAGLERAMSDRFSSLAGAAPEAVRDEIYEALAIRRDAEAFDLFVAEAARAASAPLSVTLEIIAIDEESYVFAVAWSGQDGGAHVATNMRLVWDDEVGAIEESAALDERALPAGSEAAKLLAALGAGSFPEGAGGDADVLDGATTLLSICDSGGAKAAILHGFGSAVFEEDANSPPKGADRDRWEAMEMALRIIVAALDDRA